MSAHVYKDLVLRACARKRETLNVTIMVKRNRQYALTPDGIAGKYKTKAQRRKRLADIANCIANLERDRRICEIRMADYLLESDILKQQGGVPPPGPLPDTDDKDT